MLAGIIIALVLVGAVSVAFVKWYPSKEVMNEDTVEVKLTAADNGSEFELKKGHIMVITLDANPTTGYTWEVIEPVDDQVLQQPGELEFKRESDLIGAGGMQIIRFEDVKPGQAAIRLVYHRPWETDVEPLKTFAVQVVVVDTSK